MADQENQQESSQLEQNGDEQQTQQEIGSGDGQQTQQQLNGSGQLQEIQIPKSRIFVGGISWKADEKGLTEYFSQFGKVLECKIIMDKNTNKSKGYGFVTFDTESTANLVKQRPDLSFLGKTMNVGDAMRRNDQRPTTFQQHPQQTNLRHSPSTASNYTQYYAHQATTPYQQYGHFDSNTTYYIPQQMYYPYGYMYIPPQSQAATQQQQMQQNPNQQIQQQQQQQPQNSVVHPHYLPSDAQSFAAQGTYGQANYVDNSDDSVMKSPAANPDSPASYRKQFSQHPEQQGQNPNQQPQQQQQQQQPQQQPQQQRTNNTRRSSGQHQFQQQPKQNFQQQQGGQQQQGQQQKQQINPNPPIGTQSQRQQQPIQQQNNQQQQPQQQQSIRKQGIGRGSGSPKPSPKNNSHQ